MYSGKKTAPALPIAHALDDSAIPHIKAVRFPGKRPAYSAGSPFAISLGSAGIKGEDVTAYYCMPPGCIRER